MSREFLISPEFMRLRGVIILLATVGDGRKVFQLSYLQDVALGFSETTVVNDIDFRRSFCLIRRNLQIAALETILVNWGYLVGPAGLDPESIFN